MTADRIWQIAGWTMLHYFWVGAALGLLALVVRLLSRSALPGTRYLSALGSLFLMAVAPAIIAIALARGLPVPVSPVPFSPTFDANVPIPISSSGDLPTAFGETHALKSVPAARGPAVQSPKNVITVAPTPISARLVEISAKAARYLPLAWIIGTPLVFLLTSAGLVGAERLRRQSRPVQDARIAELCQALATRLKLTCRVAVAVCDRIASPILVGIVRPVILLPAVALAGWDPQQLEMVLLHELIRSRPIYETGAA